jgi:quercetin dioxygenase-like cupin family protein
LITGALTLHESGGDRVIKAGESFTESPGNVHSVVNAGPGPARIVVSVLLPKGAEITTMMSDAGKM